MSSQKINVEFHGTAREWFGIWIVNILLSILTVGIYSAWAKVRTKKYFYQNTVIAGRNFDYHATGGQIFAGRLIIIGGVIAYSVITTIAPLFAPVIALAFAFLMPYFIAKSIKFNASNTSWANVRMGFDGSIGDSYLIYLFYPFLTALTLYTTAPFLARAGQIFFQQLPPGHVAIFIFIGHWAVLQNFRHCFGDLCRFRRDFGSFVDFDTCDVRLFPRRSGEPRGNDCSDIASLFCAHPYFDHFGGACPNDDP
jgi:hypothetical protein